MSSTEWKYYNHAMIPMSAPHEKVDTSCIEDGTIWEKNKNALFARWTSDFDCEYETNWWYCIKDNSFELTDVNAKKRYEINKGNKNFTVKEITKTNNFEDLYDVYVSAIKTYGSISIPDREEFENSIKCNLNNGCVIIGAFCKETENLCGYSLLKEYKDYITFISQKANPEFEKRAINAALVYGILEYYKEQLNDGKYICDGERSILHDTYFQSYLEKYFLFRKAYCKLHIVYNPKVKFIIRILFSFRRLLGKFKKFSKVAAVLKMQEIAEKR